MNDGRLAEEGRMDGQKVGRMEGLERRGNYRTGQDTTQQDTTQQETTCLSRSARIKRLVGGNSKVIIVGPYKVNGRKEGEMEER